MQWTFYLAILFVCVCVCVRERERSPGIGRCDPHSWSRCQWPVHHTFWGIPNRLNLNCHCHFNVLNIIITWTFPVWPAINEKRLIFRSWDGWSCLEWEYPWWTLYCVCWQIILWASDVCRVLLLWLFQGGTEEKRGFLPGDSSRRPEKIRI